MNKTSLRTIIVLLLLSFIVSACDDTSAPVVAPPVKKSAIAPAAVDTAVAEEETTPAYVYNPIGTRDPFKNPLSVIADVASDTGVPLTPLQRLDLSQLRLIGIIIGKGEPRAMVIAPDSKSFVLKKGVKIGKNNGVVVAISTKAVSVREEYIDYTGDVQTRIEEIKLPQQGGAK